jgi:uncharacterized membrane protein
MMSLNHLHPMLVHFPIALAVVGFVAEFAALILKKEVCLSRAGFYLLLTGTLAAIAAVLSGVLFTDEMAGSAGEIQETHELFAWITLSLLVVTSLIRVYLEVKKSNDNTLKWAAFGLYGLAAIAVSVTGFFGGTLVYEYMMPL